MTVTELTHVPPLVVEELTDEELERELTLAALCEDRQRRFDLLFRERQRRIAEHTQQ